MTTDADAFLMGAGGRSAKFTNYGDRVWGVVMGQQTRQQTDFKSKAKKYWDDGNPMLELVVTLLSEEHLDDNDDGLRRLYISGQMQRAVADAVRKSGAPGLRDGGKLLVQYTGEGEAQGGLNPPKLYFAKYEAPSIGMPIQTEPDEPEAMPF